MAPELTPRGWYPYEHGVERYWDGNAWTDEQRPISPIEPMTREHAWTRDADTPVPDRRRIPVSWTIVNIVFFGAIVLALVIAYRT